MAISQTFSAQLFAGNGSVSIAYPVNFPIVSKSHLYVSVKLEDDDEARILGAHEFSILQSGESYSIKTAVAVPSTGEVTVFRLVPVDQPFEFPEGGAFPVREVERAFDRIIMIIQQIARDAGLAGGVITLPDGGSSQAVLSLAVFANPAARALAKPAYVGQVGVQIAPRKIYTADALTAGAWTEYVSGSSVPVAVVPDPSLCLAFIADVGDPGSFQDAVRDTVTAIDPDYIIDGGDNGYNGGDPADWAAFAPEIAAQTYLRVRGNHSIDTPTEISADALAFSYLNTDGELWWKRSLGNGLLDVFGIESGRKTDGTFLAEGFHLADGDQYDWLKAELEASTARHKIVVLHPPVATTSLDATDLCEEMQWDILGRADAIFCGHAHFSEWLVWSGVPVINFSGAVRSDGVSRVEPRGGGDVVPLYINDIDQLIARLWVTPSDLVVDAVNIFTGKTEYSRSIYDKTPRSFSQAVWVIDPNTDFPSAPFTKILTVLGAPVRVTSVVAAPAQGTVGNVSLELRNWSGLSLVAGPISVDDVSRTSGEGIVVPWLKIGTRLYVDCAGATAGYGETLKGLHVQITGDLLG